MKSSAKKVELASVDDLFTTEQERQEADEERVVRIPLTQLHYFKGYPAMQTEVPFTGQPYRFKDDDPKMQETLDSVKKRGVRAPGLVRPDPDGGYEIISGHRRHRASELAGLEDMPVIIRDMTDEEAVIEMVDANIQREKVMPSEKAWAYRMKLEAIKHQGARTDLRRRKKVYYCGNDTTTQFFTASVSEELLLNQPLSEERMERARQLLKNMNLYEYRDVHPAALSGGQKQRLAVACAIFSEREILLLDEPTSGLDGANMRRISDALKAAASRGKTVIVITHDPEFMEECCQYCFSLK